jgi:hypothetical protein
MAQILANQAVVEPFRREIGPVSGIVRWGEVVEQLFEVADVVSQRMR